MTILIAESFPILENRQKSAAAWQMLRSLRPRLKRGAPIEREILDYLAANPEAKDTARGIIEWWLLKQMIAHTAAKVDVVLRKLVQEGRLMAKLSADGQTFYSLPEFRKRKANRLGGRASKQI